MMLTAENLIDKMLESFPCLKADYESNFDVVEKSLLHVIFGQLFKPYIISVYNESDSYDQKKQDISVFLELMATSLDSAVTSVLTDTLIEELLDDPNTFNRIAIHLGSNATSYANGIKKALGL